MSNMSYCRFRNTLNDLADAFNAMLAIERSGWTQDDIDRMRNRYRELEEREDLNGEEVDELDKLCSDLRHIDEEGLELSDDERNARGNLIALCQTIAEEFMQEE